MTSGEAARDSVRGKAVDACRTAAGHISSLVRKPCELPPPKSVFADCVSPRGWRIPLKKVRCNKRDLSRSVALEQPKGRLSIGFGQDPLRRHAAVKNKRVRHRLSLAIPANEGRTIIERRQRRCNSLQLLPQAAELPQSLSFGCFYLQCLNDLRIETSPIPFASRLITR